MELEAQTNTEETQTATPAVDSQASTPATSAAADTSTQIDATTTETPAWTPDFKFKAAGAEHEIPEMYRGLIKDQKSLEEVKRLHEKAFGLDSLAQNRDALKAQIASYAPKLQEYEIVTKNFEKLSHFVETKDFDSFFEGLNIPEKDIVAWIQHKIDMAQADPSVREAHEKARSLQAKQWEQDQQLNQYRSQAQELERAQAYNQVHQEVMASSSMAAQTYDARMGEGAFVEAVINRGIQITQATGREPGLQEVVSMLTAELSKLGVLQTAQSTAPQTPAAQQGTPVKQQKPTIPVIPAGGQSPVSTPVRSMADLQKRAAAFGL